MSKIISLALEKKKKKRMLTQNVVYSGGNISSKVSNP